MTEFTKPQIVEIINDTCERCREGWPLEWDDRDKTWRHKRQNAGSISIVICLATRLREKYMVILNG